MKECLKMILLAAAFALAACDKSGEIDCKYMVTPYFQDEEGGPSEIVPEAIGYIFIADTTEWLPTDYDQAAAGKLSSRTGSGTMDHALQGAPDEQGRLVFSSVTEKPAMVVVCFPATRSWAVRQAPIMADLSVIQTSVTFRPWQSLSSYIDSKWEVWNNDPPVRIDCTIETTVLDTLSMPADSLVGYAFWADAESWMVASLADALAGKISGEAGSGQTRTFDVQATVDGTDGKMLFEGITRRRVMLLVADSTSRTYAVKQTEVFYGQTSLSEPLTFPRSDEWPVWSAEGWMIMREDPPASPQE